MKISQQIDPSFRGQRIDKVLATLYTDYSRAKLTAWLKAGIIQINHQSANPDDKVRGDEEISWSAIPEQTHHTATAENIPLDIVYEDDALLIVNKPPGLIVHPGAGNPQGTLMNALLFYAPALAALPRAGLVHRLDKDTSGLLMVGKTLEAHTHLVRQLQAREIHREYQALVHGRVISGGTLCTGYARDSRHRLKMAVTTHGREAITHYRIQTHYPGTTLLDVNLLTGRTHQIRVHMEHLNHPIVGDPLYHARGKMAAGLAADVRDALRTFQRQALHAYRLSLTHPISQEPVSCSAPLPEDFQALLAILQTLGSVAPGDKA